MTNWVHTSEAPNAIKFGGPRFLILRRWPVHVSATLARRWPHRRKEIRKLKVLPQWLQARKCITKPNIPREPRRRCWRVIHHPIKCRLRRQEVEGVVGIVVGSGGETGHVLLSGGGASVWAAVGGHAGIGRGGVRGGVHQRWERSWWGRANFWVEIHAGGQPLLAGAGWCAAGAVLHKDPGYDPLILH